MTDGTRALRFVKSLVPKQGLAGEQTLWIVRIAIIFVVLLGILTLIGLPFGKTTWYWLDLLIVPAVIAVVGTVGGAWFTRQRAQETALQAYLDQMSELLIDKGLHEKDNRYDATRVTARSRTLAVLTQLDGDRKKSILRFLYEAQLINRWEKKLKPDDPTAFKPQIVELDDADLRNANLRYLTLEEAALDGAILENANLRDAKLKNVDLGGAYLSGADLSNAILRGASLVNAHLQRKDRLNLNGADLSGANLSGADLSGAYLSDANLSGAKLLGAHFQRKDERGLRSADLSGAHLRNADLSDANLYGANLSGADLAGAQGVTKEQLDTCRSLERATMPNGQKYEDWLKDK